MTLLTRTTNPLHFEDLEPHRFEDLVRQLAYEFKPWRKLEATGRSGSDGGFDARGLEFVGDAQETVGFDDQAADEQPGTGTDRLWLVQCKREKAIGPAKLEKYLNEIPEGERERLHGVVFSAACEFSKKARDSFDAKCRSFGFAEWHLWGKGELEDMLFQPTNDHLLFAYFGFSLAIRRRSLRAEVRARLAMKRKAYRILGDHTHQPVLLRDPRDSHYPYSDNVPDFDLRPPWRVYLFNEFVHSGAKFNVRRAYAYIGDDGKHWDAAVFYNDLAMMMPHDNPWALDPEQQGKARKAILQLWEKLPDKNKAWLEVRGIVPFEDIMDIDEHGDDWTEIPHVYAEFNEDSGPFKYLYGKIVNVVEAKEERIRIHNPPADDRVVFFPEEYRYRPGESPPAMPVPHSRPAREKIAVKQAIPRKR